MNHGDFVKAWGDGQLEVDVDRTKALQIVNSKILPMRYQVAHIFWSWVWMLSIPAAIGLAVLYRWWAGVLVLFFVTPSLSRAIKKSAMEFMIDHAIENPDFFKFAIKEDVISIRRKGDCEVCVQSLARDNVASRRPESPEKLRTHRSVDFDELN